MHFTEIFIGLEIQLPAKHNFIEHEFIQSPQGYNFRLFGLRAEKNCYLHVDQYRLIVFHQTKKQRTNSRVLGRDCLRIKHLRSISFSLMGNQYY